jgi:hypothetical protein
MSLQTPYLKRERGFLHFGFPDGDENVEIPDTTPLDKKKTAVTDLQTNHCNENFFLSIPE